MTDGRYVPRSFLVTLVVLAIACGSGSAKASVRGNTLYLDLEEGQDQVEETVEYIITRDWTAGEPGMAYTGEVYTEFSPGEETTVSLPDFRVSVGGDVDMELLIAIRSRGHDDSFLEMDVDGTTEGWLFRRRIPRGIETLALNFRLVVPHQYWVERAYIEDDSWYPNPDLPDYDVVFVLRRLVTYCSMWASVSGDLSGSHRGDIAYFNVFPPGSGVRNELASGTAADEETHEILQDFVGSGGDMLEFMDDMGIELEDSARAALEEAAADAEPVSDPGTQYEEVARSELEDFEMAARTSGDNNFGLTLTAVQHDDGFESGGDSAAGALSGLGGAMEALGAFSLGISGKGTFSDSVPDGTEYSIEHLSDIKVTSLWVAPGDRDNNLDAAKFRWDEERPGSVEMLSGPGAGGVMLGVLKAEGLRSERKYDGRYLRIDVVAMFTARDGLYECGD